MDNVMLILRGRHFRSTVFEKNRFCGCAKAAADLFHTTHVYELVNRIIIKKEEYKHPPYTFKSFCKDYLEAKASNFGEEIIRILPLEKIAGDTKASIRTMEYRKEPLTVKNFKLENLWQGRRERSMLPQKISV
jgi:hypothetical protein